MNERQSPNSPLGHAHTPVSIRPRYRRRPVDGEGLYLLSERDTKFFEGQVFADLSALLTERISPAVAADLLADRHEPAVTHYAFDEMARAHVLTTEEGTGAVAELVDAWLPEVDSGGKPFVCESVTVTSLNDIDPDPTVHALASLGLRSHARTKTAPADLQIVLTSDYLDPELEAIGRRNFTQHRTWLLARPTGTEVWIGPWFTDSGPCYECLSFTLGTNRAVDRHVARATGSRIGITGSTTHTRAHEFLVAGLVALHTLRMLARPQPEKQIHVIDLLDFDASDHPVRQRPQCRLCGDAALQARIMTSVPNLAPKDVNAQPGLADLRHLVSPVTGVVSRVEPTPSGLCSGHTATAYTGFGGDASDLFGFKNSAISQGAGVGATAEEAEHGALCEALERYSCMTMGDEPWLIARYADLDPSTTLSPTECTLYSERQYELRHETNRRGAAFDIVPEPFDEDAPLAWTGVWSLSAHRFKLVPSSYLFFFFPQISGPYCWADSNGCAAGTSLSDAVTRGIAELVERDAVAIWWYNRLARPGLKLEASGDPELARIQEAHEDIRREVWALDLTADLGIPTFATVSRSLAGGPEDIVLGFGADLSPHRALRHAVLEMNHILPAVLPAHRTENGDYPYPERAQRDWWRSATTNNQPYLLPSHWLTSLPQPTADLSQTTSVQPLQRLLAALDAAGLEVLVLDLTRPDIGLPVAKVIVPALRHFWARLAPGRLYDVPVSLGWLSTPTPERDLNPIAMFL